jgi:hypothetical protein
MRDSGYRPTLSGKKLARLSCGVSDSMMFSAQLRGIAGNCLHDPAASVIF